MSKKYIVIVPFWPLGTPKNENYFFLPAKLAAQRGYKTSIFVLSEKNRDRENFFGIPVYFFQSPFELLRKMPTNAVLHFQTASRKVLLLLFLTSLFKKKRKIFWIPHTSFNRKNRPFGFPVDIFKLFSFIFKKLDKIIAISEYEQRYLENLGYKNVTFSLLVIDKERFTPLKKKKKKSFNILFVGGDREVKGLSGVLKAAAVLGKLGINHNLFVLGKVGKEFRENHRDLINERVKFLGFVEPDSKLLAKVFRNCDCYVNNSLQEGCPLAALEAAASGLFLCLPDLPTLRSIFKEDARYHSCDHYSDLAESLLFCFLNTAS